MSPGEEGPALDDEYCGDRGRGGEDGSALFVRPHGDEGYAGPGGGIEEYLVVDGARGFWEIEDADHGAGLADGVEDDEVAAGIVREEDDGGAVEREFGGAELDASE
jgi:hypothetical protein